ncbi:g2997 [Coccomyxa elongata]
MPVYRLAAEGNFQFEYLDHTADIQIHAWGRSLEEAFASAGLGMYNYMTPLSDVAVDPACTRTFDVEGHDEQSLLYNFLDELLFVFGTEMLVCREITVVKLDRMLWRIHAIGKGEHFERGRHSSGTEIKAITYSAMQITEKENDAEVFVIVDI